MDAVLPVSVRDCQRALLCLRSVARFFRGLGTVWVVHPDGAAHRFAALADRFSFVRLVAESDVIPGGARSSVLHRALDLVRPGTLGWYRQQLIKLAMARRVGTPFYLTLDADVLCTRELATRDLFEDGRALAVRHEMCHPSWHWIAAAILRMPRLRQEYGVTPVVLHAASCLELLRHLGRGRSPDDPYWVQRLGKTIGWTEYALYYTFLAHTGRLEQLHRQVPYGTWFGPCAWSPWLPGDASWTPAATFSCDRTDGWFSLFSSRSQVPIEALEAMVDPYLPDE